MPCLRGEQPAQRQHGEEYLPRYRDAGRTTPRPRRGSKPTPGARAGSAREQRVRARWLPRLRRCGGRWPRQIRAADVTGAALLPCGHKNMEGSPVSSLLEVGALSALGLLPAFAAASRRKACARCTRQPRAHAAPGGLGSALTNPHITTDFSESQVEL